MTMENNKFDMFAGLEERDFNEKSFNEVDDVQNTNQETELEVQEGKKRFNAGPTRTKEEYEEMIDSVHYETHYRPESGEEYQVRVTVLKPEVNPLENMRPVFAYSTNH